MRHPEPRLANIISPAHRMQPPRPFPGAPYDKDMFTFLPAPPNTDVLAESSRKRKLSSSDHQNTGPAPTVSYGFEILDPKLNVDDWRGKMLLNSGPPPPFGESFHSADYSHKTRYRDQHNCAPSQDSDKRDLHESRPRYAGYSSFSGHIQSPNHKDSLSLSHMSEVQTHKNPIWSSLMPGDFNQLENHESNTHRPREKSSSHLQEFQNCVPHKPVQMKGLASCSHEQASKNQGESQTLQQNFLNPGAFVVGFDGKDCQNQIKSAWLPSATEDFNQLENRQSNTHVAREENASHFQEFQNFGLEKPVQMKVVASGYHEQASKDFGELQCLQKFFINPRASIVGVESVDGNCCHEKTNKVEHSSHVSLGVDACNSTGFDSNGMLVDNVSNPIYNLEETNNLLQNALKLLSASGIGLPDNYGGKIQGHGHDVKMMKSTPDSGSQNVNHSQVEATLSNNGACPNLDKPGLNGEKGSIKLDECKSENDVSTPTEQLWDGTLQLSSSVSVSAIAFFKSGEKMQDFSWSESVEVKGKVRLEAFEKYVQDLPRSRTRGLMVMSLCLKEGSSDSGHKGMKEVARKYKEGKRVGFAKLSSGVDMYICPHSDKIITILAKHGFFKGMTAVAKDKCDPLLGCVVWRKNNTSSVATTKTTKVTDPQSGPSLSSPSATHVTSKSSVMPSKNQETTTLSSGKDQQLVEGGGERSNLTSISGTITQLSEVKTDKELIKSILPVPTVTSDDDDDLPEYDFRVAVSQRTGLAQVGSETSTISGPPKFQFQELVSQNTGLQSGSCVSGLPGEPQKQTTERTDIQGLVPQNKRHQPEVQIPSLPVLNQKLVVNSAANMKPRNLFDDDDMPEWCPPDFTKPRQELAQRTEWSFVSNHSKAPVSGFSDPASVTPPSTQMQFPDKHYPSAHVQRAIADQPASADEFSHKGPPGPPGFAPNPDLRPKFDSPRGKNPVHPPSWGGSRP